MSVTVRPAAETSHPYRLVGESDLVAGLEVLCIEADTRIDPAVDPQDLGRWIRLDDDPVQVKKDFGPCVFFRFVAPHPYRAPEGFVELDEFLGEFERRPNDGNAYYWIPL